MSWFNVWDGLKNKTCRYLLQRYLGQFLKEELNLEQLKIELFNGKATVNNVSLKREALNDIFMAHGWALEVIDGHIGTITVTVPWNALMTNETSIEISNLTISFRPTKTHIEVPSMLESMWSSASSSIQLAKACMQQSDDEIDGVLEMNSNAIEGLEKFAETIENVMNRIAAKFTNTTLRLEYMPSNCSRVFAVVLNVGILTYKNETDCKIIGEELNSKSNVSENLHYFPLFIEHSLRMNGIRLFTDEFENFKNKNDESEQFKSYFKNNGTTNILMAEIKDDQKIQIKVKQPECSDGPQVWLDVELGSVCIFMTPRQVRLLLKMYDAFYEEDFQIKCGTNIQHNEKVLRQENNQYGNIQRSYMTGVVGHRGNFGEQFEENNEANLYDKKNTECVYQKFDKYCDSLSSSVTFSGVTTNLKKCKRKMANMDSYGEILNLNARINSIFCIILQQDLRFECGTNNTKNQWSEQFQLNTIQPVEKFFSFVSNERKEDQYKKTFEFCEQNHLVCFLSPIFIKGNQHRNKKILLYKFSLTATNLDILEVLNKNVTPIIMFDREEVIQTGYHRRPEFEMSLKSSTSCSTKELNSLSFDIDLLKFTLELDISIYDRLSLLFETSTKEMKAPFAVEKNVPQKSSIALNITTQSFDVKLRFPMADGRPLHDPDRIPWWTQNIRDDFLLLQFFQPQLNIMEESIEIIANEINVYYCGKDCIPKLQIIKASLFQMNDKTTNELSLKFPRIAFHMPYNEESGVSTANNGSCKSTNGLNIPFSSKRECRHSDTFHINRDEAETETFFLPGETQEIDSFVKGAMNLSKIQVRISLPKISVNLESKQLYEVLYNRINSDLLMWTPASPVLQKKLEFHENLTLQKDSSTFHYTQESNFDKHSTLSKRDMTNSSSESIYYSTHDKNQPKLQKQKLCQFAIKVSIERGTFTFFAPVRDKENHVIPEQLGKFFLKTNDFELFSVNGVNNNHDLSCMCIQASEMQMFHCGLIPAGATVSMQEDNFDSEHFMQSTLYSLPEQLTKCRRIGKLNRKMLTVVIEIKRLRDQHVKRLRIATGIQKIALRHNPAQAAHTWLNQLIDFLDVTDYPIKGFNPFGVITEIQLHLWDSAIDYRPKCMKYRAVMEFGSIVISSNIISTLAGCNLRFVAEEIVLSIAQFKFLDTTLSDYKVTFIPSKYLIPVLDVGLFDISLRLCEEISKNCPQFDLRSSIHDVHLRTCADSGSAFTQLITYIANDGDFICDGIEDNPIKLLPSAYSKPAPFLNQDCEPNISQKQQERVNILMADAVRESVPSFEFYEDYTESLPNVQGVEVFYFPDENKTKKHNNDSEDLNQNEFWDILNFETNVMLNSYSTKTTTHPQVKADFGDIKRHPKFRSSSQTIQEDDYYIIADNEKSFLHHCGIKEVKLSDDPLKIVDNHFCLPISTTDLLNSPENFPMAVTRYTLCEMTFTWHMYGGTDFEDTLTQTDDQPPKREKMSEAYRHGVSYSKNMENHQLFKKPKDKLTWKTVGGLRRNHEVLVEMQFSKIRFSHELYPVFTSLASRQVLLISEVEIRDRLQASDINKFLYHPSIQKLTNKNSKPVIVLKALNVRPDPKRIGNQECSLRISLVPMRLHIDQDTLIFLADYFTSIGDICNTTQEISKKSRDICVPTAPFQSESPIMAVEEVPDAVKDLRTRKFVVTNLDLLMDNEYSCEAEVTSVNLPDIDDKRTIYFRELIFSPEISICFDYHGRRVELSRGPIAGLLMGLGQLQCSEIRLKKIVYRRGLLGLEKLITYMCKEWLSDIKKNQLPKILSGVGPTYAFVQLFQGIYDLFWMPIEQYQKDGRIIKGLQLGAQSFSARTALAALEITSRIIQLLQLTAETAFDMVTPGPSVTRARRNHKGKRKRQQRPKDFREGVSNAYHIVKEGINNSANNLIETAVTEHDQKGYTGAVGAVMRQIPQLVVCPAVLATQATTNILGGVKNSLVPDAKLEAREKWKNDSD